MPGEAKAVSTRERQRGTAYPICVSAPKERAKLATSRWGRKGITGGRGSSAERTWIGCFAARGSCLGCGRFLSLVGDCWLPRGTSLVVPDFQRLASYAACALAPAWRRIGEQKRETGAGFSTSRELAVLAPEKNRIAGTRKIHECVGGAAGQFGASGAIRIGRQDLPNPRSRYLCSEPRCLSQVRAAPRRLLCVR